ALTGTPLLKEERASCKVFGNYLHTYYYDKSIADGYTLKIIREVNNKSITHSRIRTVHTGNGLKQIMIL
ncbi:hypothetical protein CLI75_12095, partial [Porphyromonas gingivalis]